MSAVISALATLVRASHDVEALDDVTRDSWRAKVQFAKVEYDHLRARVTELEQEVKDRDGLNALRDGL